MSNSRGIRGAITVGADTPKQIENAVVELYTKILEENEFETADISHIIFTMTKDITSAYPAKFLRKHFDMQYVPLICMNEMYTEDGLELCLRVLIVVNTDKKQDEMHHVFLGGAKILRPDLVR